MSTQLSNRRAFAGPVIPNDERTKEDDRNLKRYVWMAGPDINLGMMSASQFVGDFPGDVIPARQLTPLPEARSTGTFELKAQVMTEETTFQGGSSGSFLDAIPNATTGTPTAEQFITNLIKGVQPKSRLTRYLNPPKVCAYMLMRKHDAQGLALLEAIKGWDEDDVQQAYRLFWPVTTSGEWDESRIGELGWDMERTVLEVNVEGPFLDQVSEYLKPNGQAGLILKSLAGDSKGRGVAARLLNAAMEMKRVMATACNRAEAFFTVHLNTSDAEIQAKRAGNPGKVYYDLPDFGYVGGTLPLDIQALANMNRSPLDERIANEQSAREEKNHNVTLQGFEMLAGKIGGGGGISTSDLEKIIDAKVAKAKEESNAYWKAELKKLGIEDIEE